ncbi:CAP-Gly domain-containing linker protein 2, partial [Dinochytrium kinnereticum]
MGKDAIDKNTRILLDRQKKAYQILVAKLRREIRRLKFQRNSLSDPLIEAKYFPYLPRTPYGTSARKPPLGIIGNLPSRSSDYFALNPPPPTGNHPDSGNRWWWGSGPDLSSHLPTRPSTEPSHTIRKNRIVRPSQSHPEPKSTYHPKPPSNKNSSSRATPPLPTKLEPLAKPEPESEMSWAQNHADVALQREPRVGDRACVMINEERCLGMVKYVGIFDPYPETGLWCGIKLDRPLGKHDGVVRGKRYFTCEENHGLFVKIEKIIPIFHAGGKRTSTIKRDVSQQATVH